MPKCIQPLVHKINCPFCFLCTKVCARFNILLVFFVDIFHQIKHVETCSQRQPHSFPKAIILEWHVVIFLLQSVWSCLENIATKPKLLFSLSLLKGSTLETVSCLVMKCWHSLDLTVNRHIKLQKYGYMVVLMTLILRLYLAHHWILGVSWLQLFPL